MLVKQVDMIGSQASQRTFDGCTDMFGATVAIGADLLPIHKAKSEFRRKNNFVTKAFKCTAEELFVYKRSIDLRRIEERTAELDCTVQSSERFNLIGRTL